MTSISPFASVCSRSPRGDTELDIAPIQRLSQHYQVTCHLSDSFLRCVRSSLLISATRSTSASICSVRAIRRGGGGEGLRGKRHPFALVIGIMIPASLGLIPTLTSSASASFDPGIGNVPQGTQSDQAYRDSFAASGVTNVFVTGQQVSCYRPEVPFLVNNGPNDGYTGEVPCPGATTHEHTGGAGPYPTQ